MDISCHVLDRWTKVAREAGTCRQPDSWCSVKLNSVRHTLFQSLLMSSVVLECACPNISEGLIDIPCLVGHHLWSHSHGFKHWKLC